MQFVSTRKNKEPISFSQAISRCICPDGGYYVPAYSENLRQWIYYLNDKTSFSSIAGSLTTALMKGMDELNKDVILLATTNMISHFDKALLRRFDKIVDFSRYSEEDLMDIAEKMLDSDLKKFKFPLTNKRLCKKIIETASKIPYPGDLKNIIRTSIVFSNPSNPNEYVVNLMKALCPDIPIDSATLKEHGFSLREMEVLTGLPKSTIARKINGEEC